MTNTGKILGLLTERYVFCPLRKIMTAPQKILKKSLAGKIIKINHANYFTFYERHLIL